MIKKLVKGVYTAPSVALEMLSDYFAWRDANIEYESPSFRGQCPVVGISCADGGLQLFPGRPLSEEERRTVRAQYSIMDRMGHKYNIFELLQTGTAWLAHPFGGERITQSKGRVDWMW